MSYSAEEGRARESSGTVKKGLKIQLPSLGMLLGFGEYASSMQEALGSVLINE